MMLKLRNQRSDRNVPIDTGLSEAKYVDFKDYLKYGFPSRIVFIDLT
jgi:hypothetical protein